MEKFEIRIVGAAEQDLNQIFGYIADTLHEPEAAARLLLSFREAIDSLQQLPFRQRPLQEEPYTSLGVRRLFVGNYIVFYSAIEGDATIQILRVLYKRREWQALLEYDQVEP
ncbi:MAG TPA: type II toxin-antitoxin system RelE/ParE family toxin [Clostridia bacterium]|nr:type II toxin-antitoxin system RelE/ParE family toxin [Clostridia bacterium]